MNERDGIPSDASRSSATGGQMLRQLREERGVPLEGLASMLKVTPAKLDALESGRYHELPDAAFTRALAMTVCRLLKADPAAVLAHLPQAQLASLSASEPNQVPFKAKHARLNLDVSAVWPWREFMSTRWLLPAGVLLAAALLYVLPQDWMNWRTKDSAHAVAAAVVVSQPPSWPASDPVSPASAPGAAMASVAAMQAASLPASGAGLAGPSTPLAGSLSPYESVAAPGAASAPSVTDSTKGLAGGSALVINVTASSWVEVRDATGSRLLSRHVTPGETVGVDGVAPLTIKIGNVSGVSLNYKGQGVDLSSYARNNVARLELK